MHIRLGIRPSFTILLIQLELETEYLLEDYPNVEKHVCHGKQ